MESVGQSGSCAALAQRWAWAWILHLGQECFDPLDFKPPEFRCTGPLLHPIAVGRDFK